MNIRLKSDIDVEGINSGDVIVFVNGGLSLVVTDNDEEFCLLELDSLRLDGSFTWNEFLKFIDENEVKRIIKNKNLELREV